MFTRLMAYHDGLLASSTGIIAGIWRGPVSVLYTTRAVYEMGFIIGNIDFERYYCQSQYVKHGDRMPPHRLYGCDLALTPQWAGSVVLGSLVPDELKK